MYCGRVLFIFLHVGNPYIKCMHRQLSFCFWGQIPILDFPFVILVQTTEVNLPLDKNYCLIQPKKKETRERILKGICPFLSLIEFFFRCSLLLVYDIVTWEGERYFCRGKLSRQEIEREKRCIFCFDSQVMYGQLPTLSFH